MSAKANDLTRQSESVKAKITLQTKSNPQKLYKRTTLESDELYCEMDMENVNSDDEMARPTAGCTFAAAAAAS